ncbi:ABC transporter permease [Luteococcus sp. Sow4_B9]|uniref:ABC transporter permease n=1 Tax=Luteococcus sp. Sow4_B9 TaxID=3438792 RepID=UPI003F9ADAAF
MWKATFTSLWSRKLRLAMSMLAIILGVSFVSGSMIFGDMMTGSFDQIVSGTVSDVDVVKKTDEAVTDGAANTSKLDDAVAAKIKAVDGVSEVGGSVYGMDAILIGKNGKALTSFGPPQMGFSWIDLPALKGNKGGNIIEGREPRSGDEVVVDPQSLKKSGYQVGDRAKVITPTKGTLQFTIVGTGTFGEGSSAGASYVFFTTERAQEIFLDGSPSYSSFWVVTTPEADRAAVASQIQKVLPRGYEAKDGQLVADETSGSIGDALKFVNAFPLVFAGISLLVATFLIVNTFTILVAQRSRELALFRAMGASKRQLRQTVLAEAFIVGLVSSVIGLFLGVGIAVLIKQGMAAGGWDLGSAPITLGLPAIVASLLTGTVVTVLAALGPARRATRISPIEAMTAARTETDQGLGRRAVVGVVLALLGVVGILLGLFTEVPQPVVWSGLGMALAMVGVAIASPLVGRPVVWAVSRINRVVFGEIGKLAELNSIRQPRRTAATASALMVGLTLVSMLAIFGSSATRSVTAQIENTVRGNYLIGQQGFKEFPLAVREKIGKVDSVDKVHAMKIGTFLEIPDGRSMPTPEAFNDVTGRYWVALGGMELESVNKIFPQQIVQGRMFTGEGEMVVAEETAKEEGIQLGHTQKLFAPESQRIVDVKVVGIYSPGDGQTIMDKWVSTKTLTDAGLGQKDAFLAIYLKPGADTATARADLDQALSDMPLVSVMDVSEYTDTILQNVDRTMAVLYALLALSVLIAVLGIVNTLGLSIVERTREIGLLRAIALTRAQVRRMITLESVVIALLGAVVGVGLGTVFGIVLQRLMADDGINMLSIPWGQLALFVVAAGVVGVLAAVWPAHRAASTDVLRAIASE